MKKPILRRIVEAVSLAVASSAALVGQAFAAEFVRAPRATITAECLTAKPGFQHEVAELQKRIAALREQGDNAQADDLFAYMTTELMEQKWLEVKKNLVVTGGKNDLLDKYFSGSGYTAAWFCGLVSSVSFSAYAAGDTMASHAGWTEAGGANAPTYSGNRPALTFAAASGASKATSSPSSFTFTGAGTIKGMFCTSVTTKDGTTGILYNAVNFTGGDRVVANTDVVNVSVTFTA